MLACRNVGRADTFACVSLAKAKKNAVFKLETVTGALSHIAGAGCDGEPAALVANPTGTVLFVSLRPGRQIGSFCIHPRARILMQYFVSA
jgi:hypothetical protein